MAVKLRLMRVGKTKQPSYRVVAADARSPRDGRFIEIVGQYNPRSEPSVVTIDNDKALKWLRQGAQPTERVQKLLEISGAWSEFKGVRSRRERRRDLRRRQPRSGTDGHGRARSRGAGTGRRPRLGLASRAIEGRRGITLEVRVAPGDMGRLIGKRGRTAQSIRTVVRAAATRDGVSVDVDFVD